MKTLIALATVLLFTSSAQAAPLLHWRDNTYRSGCEYVPFSDTSGQVFSTYWPFGWYGAVCNGTFNIEAAREDGAGAVWKLEGNWNGKGQAVWDPTPSTQYAPSSCDGTGCSLTAGIRILSTVQFAPYVCQSDTWDTKWQITWEGTCLSYYHP